MGGVRYLRFSVSQAVLVCAQEQNAVMSSEQTYLSTLNSYKFYLVNTHIKSRKKKNQQQKVQSVRETHGGN